MTTPKLGIWRLSELDKRSRRIATKRLHVTPDHEKSCLHTRQSKSCCGSEWQSRRLTRRNTRSRNAEMSSQVAKAARRVTHELHGVVISAGLMQKSVKVRVGGQKWNKVVNKVSMTEIPVEGLRSDLYASLHLTDNCYSGFLTQSIILSMTQILHYGQEMWCLLCLDGRLRDISDML